MQEMQNNMGNGEYISKQKITYLSDKFDERMAYEIANGKVMANPLVDKEGMINLVRL